MGNIVKTNKKSLIASAKRPIKSMKKLKLPTAPGDEGYDEFVESQKQLEAMQNAESEETHRRFLISSKSDTQSATSISH